MESQEKIAQKQESGDIKCKDEEQDGGDSGTDEL
jgi:hypothetical protein